MAIAAINPATGELLRRFDPLTNQEIERKLQQTAEAFAVNRMRSFAERAGRMHRAAAILEQRQSEYGRLITTEMGKPVKASIAEVNKCALVCRYYAEHAQSHLADEHVQTEAEETFVRWEPLGIVLAVMPWNFPFWQVFRFLAPALMAGNVALLKHASNVPQCALAIESLVRRAGFPRGTFQSLLLEVNQVESVLADERIAAVTVTGSETAGRAIGAQAGWLIKKSVLELGGSDPFIVMPSADRDLAVEPAVRERC